ncbi:hypothetical protein KGO5_05379 [Sinorhizobium sp. KGO-5]|nr:hypothetical protein KGO5_05379 [Sinorhizobium sp. KGO-5]
MMRLAMGVEAAYFLVRYKPLIDMMQFRDT